MFEILVRRLVGGHFRTLKFLEDRFALDDQEGPYSEVTSVFFYRVIVYRFLGFPISRWIAEIESPKLTLSTFWFNGGFRDCQQWVFILAAVRRFIAPHVAAAALSEIRNPLGRFELGPITLTQEGIHVRRYLVSYFLRWEDYAGCRIGTITQTTNESPSILWPEAVGKESMLILKTLPNGKVISLFSIWARENMMPITADVLYACYRAIILGDNSPEPPDDWLLHLMSDPKKQIESGMKMS